MLERCKSLGIHGAYVQMLTVLQIQLYDKVLMQVSVIGEIGTPFDTYISTKQGRELSPCFYLASSSRCHMN